MKNIDKNRIYKMILLLGVSLVTVAAIINSESGSTIISMGDVDIPEGGSDWSFLKINDVSNLGSCDITLSWDPDVVTVTDVGDSDFDSMDYYVEDSTGILNLNAFSYDAMNGDFTIAKVTFEPAYGASDGDECDLEITDSVLLTAEPTPSEIFHSRENGRAQINNVGASVLVAIDDVYIPQGGNDRGHLRTYNILNIGSCDVTLSWDPDVVTVTDVSNSDFDSMNYYLDDVAGVYGSRGLVDGTSVLALRRCQLGHVCLGQRQRGRLQSREQDTGGVQHHALCSWRRKHACGGGLPLVRRQLFGGSRLLEVEWNRA